MAEVPNTVEVGRRRRVPEGPQFDDVEQAEALMELQHLRPGPQGTLDPAPCRSGPNGVRSAEILDIMSRCATDP